MHRLAIVVTLLVTVGALAQNSPVSDPFAVTLAQQSVLALTGGIPLSDVTLNANAISVLGSDGGTGTATLKAKGVSESRIDLALSKWTKSDIRNALSGVPSGVWIKDGGTPNAYAIHNSWTDAPWFFPALSSLTQTLNPNFIFKYIGQEQHSGITVQHIRVFQIVPSDTKDEFQTARLSATNFYLDSTTSLPMAESFRTHPDNDMNTDIDIEIRFGNYQAVSGVQIPFRVQRMLHGNVVLDLTVTSAVVNSGLTDVLFSF